jgi:hypothetical protein
MVKYNKQKLIMNKIVIAKEVRVSMIGDGVYDTDGNPVTPGLYKVEEITRIVQIPVKRQGSKIFQNIVDFTSSDEIDGSRPLNIKPGKPT